MRPPAEEAPDDADGFRTVQTIITSIFVVLTFFHSRMPHKTIDDGGKYFAL